MSHTPGPWEATGNGVHKRASSHYAGCVATTHNNENRKADAKLIAAATELFECLLEVVEDGLKTNTKDWQAKARAAIAKAEQCERG